MDLVGGDGFGRKGVISFAVAVVGTAAVVVALLFVDVAWRRCQWHH